MSASASLRALPDAEVDDRLQSFPDWSRVEGRLHRELRFADFTTALGFMVQVGVWAEKLDHHPEWSNVYSRVVIDLVTHDVDGISDRDFELAARIDEVAGVSRSG